MGLRKIYKYIYYLNQLKHHSGYHSRTGRRKRILTAGNILFLGIAAVLLIYFIIAAIVDFFRVLQLAPWPGAGTGLAMDVPVVELIWGAVRQFIDAVLMLTLQDILSFGGLTLATLGAIILALLDEALGAGILVIACIVRVMNQFYRPMEALSWILLFASLIPSDISYL